MYKFYLHFATSTALDTSYTRHEIAEPIGFDSANWQLQQESGRYGRDVLFSPDSFTFSSFVEIQGLTHRFNDLVQTYETRGFEANVLFEIEIDGTSYILGQLDFTTVETDLLKYFTCNIIQLNDEAVIKRRMEVKVDLYSDEDYNGLPIDPLEPVQILLKAQPLQQVSTWIIPNGEAFMNGGVTSATFRHLNPAVEIIKSGVHDTLSSPWAVYDNNGSLDSGLNEYAIFRATTRANDVKLKFRNGAWVSLANVSFQLEVRVGVDAPSSTGIYLESVNTGSDPNQSIQTNFSADVTIPEILQGEKIFVWFRYRTLNPTDRVDFTSLDVELNLTSISYNSLTDGIRLIDAMKQTVKSISGLDVVAPRFDEDGEHYEQYIFKGNQIRLIQDKPFTISFQEILEYLPEVNCDYQVNSDGTVFIGHETDFYSNQSAGSFPISPNNVFSQKINERFTYNKIKYSYDKYEKGENELQNNALFGVNTEFEMTVPNRFVENTKDIKIPFIRDAYRIEKMRRDSILITENAPTIDDEDVVILDVIENESLQQVEVFLLNHLIDYDPLSGGNKLSLLNDGSFRWDLIGFYVGLTFTISDGENVGAYTVLEIEDTRMYIAKNTGSPDFNGIALTELTWTVSTVLSNRTDEGFQFLYPDAIEDGITNLKYAAKRNLQKYWRGNIKAASQFYPSGTIRNTFFRNGANVRAIFTAELSFTERDQDRDLFINLLGNPILSSFIIETEVICDFEDFWDLLTDVRENKKYVEVANTKDILVKLHPKELSYNIKDKLLTIIGEQRWQ